MGRPFVSFWPHATSKKSKTRQKTRLGILFYSLKMGEWKKIREERRPNDQQKMRVISISFTNPVAGEAAEAKAVIWILIPECAFESTPKFGLA